MILLGLKSSILLAFMFMPLTASNHRGITVFAADEFARPFQIGEILNIDQYTAIALIAVVAVFAALSGYYLVTRRHKARQQTPVLRQEPGRVTKLPVAKQVLAYDEEQPEMMSAPEPTQRTRGEYKGFFEFRDDSSGARARAVEEKVESPPIMPRKYCSNCGEAISAQAKFCDKCGATQ